MKNLIVRKHEILCLLFIVFVLLADANIKAQPSSARNTQNFSDNWNFYLGEAENGQAPALDDSKWRELNLPHDWSIEGEFSKDNPAGIG